MVHWWYKTNLDRVSRFTQEVLSRIRPEPGRTQGGSLSGYVPLSVRLILALADISSNDDPYYGTLLWSASSSESTNPTYPEGYYTIKSYTGDHYATTPSNSISANTQLTLDTNPTQWYFLPLGNEYYQLLPASSSASVVVYTGSTTYSPTNGSKVALQGYSSQESETWKIMNVSEAGYVIFTARDSITQQIPVTEYSWGVADGNTSVSTALELVQTDDTNSAQWFMITALSISMGCVKIEEQD
jgi:hypothetical protein